MSVKKIKDEDELNTSQEELITENYELEVLGLKNPADFRKFSRSFMKLDNIIKKIKDLTDTKEPKFSKNTGFNLPKTDSYQTDDTNKLFTAKGAKALYTIANKKIERKKIEGSNAIGFQNGELMGIFLDGGNEVNFMTHNNRVLFNYKTYKDQIKKKYFYFLAGENDGTTLANVYAKELYANNYKVYSREDKTDSYQTDDDDKIVTAKGVKALYDWIVKALQKVTNAIQHALDVANTKLDKSEKQGLVGFENGNVGIFTGWNNTVNFKSNSHLLHFNYEPIGDTVIDEINFKGLNKLYVNYKEIWHTGNFTPPQIKKVWSGKHNTLNKICELPSGWLVCFVKFTTGASGADFVTSIPNNVGANQINAEGYEVGFKALGNSLIHSSNGNNSDGWIKEISVLI